jgi:hypothetical protein
MLLVVAALALATILLISGCHASSDKNFSQTFVSEDNAGDSLKLNSKTGLVRPAAEFPHNIFFKLFGSDTTSGSYERIEGETTTKGTFEAGTDGEKQWIRFTSEDKREWDVEVKPGGLLVGDGEIVWKLTTTVADARAKSEFGFKFGN